MTQLPIMIRCNLSGLVYMDPRHSIFVNHRFEIFNGVQEINSKVPFMVLVISFSNTVCKIPKHIVLGYAALNTALIIPPRPDSSLLAHFHAFFGLTAQHDSKSTADKKSNQRQELIVSPTESVQGPLISQEFGRLDGTSKDIDNPIYWWDQVYLSDVKDQFTKKLITSILEKHQDMLSGQLGTIKGPPHRIDADPGTRPIKQLPYRSGPKRRQLIDEHVDKTLAAEFIEPSQSYWASKILKAPKKDGTPEFL